VVGDGARRVGGEAAVADDDVFDGEGDGDEAVIRGNG